MFIVRKPGAKGRGQPAPHPEVLEWRTGEEGKGGEGRTGIPLLTAQGITHYCLRDENESCGAKQIRKEKGGGQQREKH